MQTYDVSEQYTISHPSSRTANRGPAAQTEETVLRGNGAKSATILIVGVVLTIALSAVMPRVFSMALTPSAVQYVEVTVLPGQTLWQIAGQHKDERTDTRRMVERIRTANELPSASVYPGQVLRIPVTQP